MHSILRSHGLRVRHSGGVLFPMKNRRLTVFLRVASKFLSKVAGYCSLLAASFKSLNAREVLSNLCIKEGFNCKDCCSTDSMIVVM